MKHASWIAIAGLTLAAASPAFAQYGGGCGGGGPPPPPPTQGGGAPPPAAGGGSTPGAGAPSGPATARPGDTTPTGGRGAITPGKPTYAGPTGPITPGGMTPRSPGVANPTTPGSGNSAPRSPKGSGVTGDDPGSWRVWWTLNHDRFVDVAAHAPTAASDGMRSDKTEILAQLRTEAYERLAPIVTRVIQQEKNEILLGRALIAMAKLGESPKIANSREVYKLILPFVNNDKTRIAESAALALGILGHDDAVMALSQIAALSPNAQGDGRGVRVRTFALYGLGLAARDSKREDVRRVAASRLCAIFSEEKGTAVDVKVACLQALSMVPLAADTQAMVQPGGAADIPSASRTAEVEWVLRELDAATEATWVRAQAATTAARLCADQSEGSALRSRVADTYLSRSSPESTTLYSWG